MTDKPPTDAELDELLDDALEQFTVETPVEKKPIEPVKEEDTDFEQQFAQELAKSMEGLLKDQPATDNPEEMNQSIEQLMKQIQSLQADLGDKTQDKPTQSPQGSFQDKIKATMDKLKESANQANDAQAGGEEMDMMEELMKQMDEMGDSGQFDSLVDDVIGQLMSKDVLYEPLKDLDREYPKYLANNEVSEEDRERYTKQHEYVRQIIGEFEKKETDDGKITELMQKMQELGQPPKELLKIMAPDVEVGEDGEAKLPDTPECSVM